jgi:membrane fusion protein (multidrug efflux system)
VLRAGEFVRIVLHGAVRPGAIVVPQRAVLESPKGKYVYVVSAESKGEPRPVEVGDWSGDGWIINGGLKAGERVVVDGVVKLQLMGPAGGPVQIGDPAAPGADKGAPGKGSPGKSGAPDKGGKDTGKAPPKGAATPEKK